jgi:hypothetical protein
MTRSQANFPRVMIEGNMDAGGWSCGRMVGLINYIPPES